METGAEPVQAENRTVPRQANCMASVFIALSNNVHSCYCRQDGFFALLIAVCRFCIHFVRHRFLMMQYYYIDSGGNTAGPIDQKRLISMHRDGEIDDNTEVATVGSSSWIRCGEALAAKTDEKEVWSVTQPDSLLLPPSQLSGVAAGSVAKVPISGPVGPLKCHEIHYKVMGNDLQVVEIELDPGETVVAEAGALNYLESGISFEAKMGDGSKPDQGILGKLLDLGKRKLTGESVFMTHFKNEVSSKKRVAFAASYPGKILCLEMSELGEEIFCQKDAFLCAALGTEISVAFQKKLGVGFFGGEGFVLQKLIGDGMAFVHAGGTIAKKELSGESLLVEPGCLVAFSKGIDYDIELVGGLKSMFFGGEGMFFVSLRGHGTVWLQSLPFSRLAERVLQVVPTKGSSPLLGD